MFLNYINNIFSLLIKKYVVNILNKNNTMKKNNNNDNIKCYECNTKSKFINYNNKIICKQCWIKLPPFSYEYNFNLKEI